MSKTLPAMARGRLGDTLRAFGPGLVHAERMDDAVQYGVGSGGVVCIVCGAPPGRFCVGGTIPPYPGPYQDDVL